MATKIDLEKLVHEIGPGFADRSAAHDQNDTFVDENYNVLKERRVFSAIVPLELNGGGASYTEMSAFIRTLAGYCSSTALALAMHQQLVANAIFNYRNGRPGQQVLEKLLPVSLFSSPPAPTTGWNRTVRSNAPRAAIW